jgi:hypothetical protein
MSIRVLRPGLLTTLQDYGRHGLQRVGLCPGGAMDPVALALANALVGNEAAEAALEITVIGPELSFEEEALVAVCGAEFDGSFPHNRPVLAPAGSRRQATKHWRTYRHVNHIPASASERWLQFVFVFDRVGQSAHYRSSNGWAYVIRLSTTRPRPCRRRPG